MKNVQKKKTNKIKIQLPYQDLLHIKPPTRLAIEAMIENLHKQAPK